MQTGLAAAKAQLRELPLATLRALYDDNLSEYRDLRARGMAVGHPAFDDNCMMHLLLTDALADRGVRVAVGAA